MNFTNSTSSLCYRANNTTHKPNFKPIPYKHTNMVYTKQFRQKQSAWTDTHFPLRIRVDNYEIQLVS